MHMDVISSVTDVNLCDQLWFRSKKFTDTWKRRRMSEPRRDRALPHHEESQGYPDWLSHIPRKLPITKGAQMSRFMYSAERYRSPLEPKSYSQKSRQDEYSHRSRSPHVREHHPHPR